MTNKEFVFFFNWEILIKKCVDSDFENSWKHVVNSIIAGVLQDEDATTLVDLLEQANLVDALSEEGPFTVFAPTNEGMWTVKILSIFQRIICSKFSSWGVQIWNHILCSLCQGPLKKWTKNSQELHLLKIHIRGGSYYTPGLDGGWFFGPWAFIIPKSSYQDLSNEGSKLFLSSLELVF